MSVREPGVMVEFFMGSLLQGKESQDAGREIYKDVPFVRICVVGQDRFETPVREKDKKRFPEEWAAFEKGMAPVAHGTPIEQWGMITPSRARHLRNMECRTVEDIASMTDLTLQKVGPDGNKLRDAARKFLSAAQNTADLMRMEELEKSSQEKDAALRAQAEQLSNLQARVAQLAAEKAAPAAEEPDAGRPRRKQEAKAA